MEANMASGPEDAQDRLGPPASWPDQLDRYLSGLEGRIDKLERTRPINPGFDEPPLHYRFRVLSPMKWKGLWGRQKYPKNGVNAFWFKVSVVAAGGQSAIAHTALFTLTYSGAGQADLTISVDNPAFPYSSVLNGSLPLSGGSPAGFVGIVDNGHGPGLFDIAVSAMAYEYAIFDIEGGVYTHDG